MVEIEEMAGSTIGENSSPNEERRKFGFMKLFQFPKNKKKTKLAKALQGKIGDLELKNAENEKLLSENVELLKNCFGFLLEENKRLSDLLIKQKDEFEHQRAEETTKLENLQDELYQFYDNNLSVREEIKKLRTTLSNRENFLTVSDYALYFNGKIGMTRDVVLKNVSEHRVAFDSYPWRKFFVVSPDCGILEVGEEKTISVRCVNRFDFVAIYIHSVKVPADGGEVWNWLWFRGDPSTVKNTVIPCVF